MKQKVSEEFSKKISQQKIVLMNIFVLFWINYNNKWIIFFIEEYEFYVYENLWSRCYQNLNKMCARIRVPTRLKNSYRISSLPMQHVCFYKLQYISSEKCLQNRVNRKILSMADLHAWKYLYPHTPAECVPI